jgi:hypothetical protein
MHTYPNMLTLALAITATPKDALVFLASLKALTPEAQKENIAAANDLIAIGEAFRAFGEAFAPLCPSCRDFVGACECYDHELQEYPSSARRA